jgi:hypothetical protein
MHSHDIRPVHNLINAFGILESDGIPDISELPVLEYQEVVFLGKRR